ncbi:thioredoxin-like protein 4A-like protein [Pavlovales sp. CCMP2436]|nr:thioredoxin-like protein 4A-like protein [Pavlovales sp. CCMP2436]|mmetsp:Transcript_14138/g.35917  ORF Transcript_14138/g.35917 Transcript_14138/m.35917 type:complete len:150 (+) Transcript_14138:46-495(+)
MAPPATPQALASAEQVDQTLLAERDRAVLLRFGRRADPTTAAADVLLHEIAHEVWLYCMIYLVDIDDVPEFTATHELYDPCTVIVFYRNKPMPIDVGYGPESKVTWPLPESSTLADAIANACEGESEAHGGGRRGLLSAVQGLLQRIIP